MSTDDSRRLKLIWDCLDELVGDAALNVVAAEAYAPFGRAASAWKTAMCYGMMAGYAFQSNVPFWCFLPSDLRRMLGSESRASKEEVASRLYRRVSGLGNWLLEEVPKTQREHVSDAAGHAYLALQNLQSLGLR